MQHWEVDDVVVLLLHLELIWLEVQDSMYNWANTYSKSNKAQGAGRNASCYCCVGVGERACTAASCSTQMCEETTCVQL